MQIYVDYMYAYLEMMPHKAAGDSFIPQDMWWTDPKQQSYNRGSLNYLLLRRLLVTCHLLLFDYFLSGCDMLISTVHMGMLCREE